MWYRVNIYACIYWKSGNLVRCHQMTNDKWQTTNERTRKDKATQPMDHGRLRWAFDTASLCHGWRFRIKIVMPDDNYLFTRTATATSRSPSPNAESWTRRRILAKRQTTTALFPASEKVLLKRSGVFWTEATVKECNATVQINIGDALKSRYPNFLGSIYVLLSGRITNCTPTFSMQKAQK